MATAPERPHRINLDLRASRNQLIDLPMYDADWPGLPIHTRITLLYEWQDVVDRMESLSHHYQSGEMSGEQSRQYRDMLAELRASVPILKRLGWPIPRIVSGITT